MLDQRKIKPAIQRVIGSMMDKVIQNAHTKDPLIAREGYDEYSFYRVLIPDEIRQAAYLEKLFVESLGKAWQSLVQAIAAETFGFAAIDHRIIGTIKTGRLKRILSTLNTTYFATAEERAQTNWGKELAYVLKGRGEQIPVTVVCDIYVEDRVKDKRYAFELKTPLPHIDRTKGSKQKLLHLYSMERPQVDGAYYVLPYNLYSRKEDYAGSTTARWFNMEDEVVLIGDEFWERVGGPGTYQSFISAFNEVGTEYRYRIYREFLNIEPPADADDTQL